MDDPNVWKEKDTPRKSSGAPDPKDFIMASNAYSVLHSYLVELQARPDKAKAKWFGKPSKREGYLNAFLGELKKHEFNGLLPQWVRKLSNFEKHSNEPIVKLFSSKSTPDYVKNAIVELSEKAKEYIQQNAHVLRNLHVLDKGQVYKIIKASGLEVKEGDSQAFAKALQKYLQLDENEAKKIEVQAFHGFTMVNVTMSLANTQKLKDALEGKPQTTAEKTSLPSSSQPSEPESEKPPRRGPGMG